MARPWAAPAPAEVRRCGADAHGV